MTFHCHLRGLVCFRVLVLVLGIVERPKEEEPQQELLHHWRWAYDYRQLQELLLVVVERLQMQ